MPVLCPQKSGRLSCRGADTNQKHRLERARQPLPTRSAVKTSPHPLTIAPQVSWRTHPITLENKRDNRQMTATSNYYLGCACIPLLRNIERATWMHAWPNQWPWRTNMIINGGVYMRKRALVSGTRHTSFFFTLWNKPAVILISMYACPSHL